MLCHTVHHLESCYEILYLAGDLSKDSTVICSHTLVVGTTQRCTFCVSVCMSHVVNCILEQEVLKTEVLPKNEVYIHTFYCLVFQFLT